MLKLVKAFFGLVYLRMCSFIHCVEAIYTNGKYSSNYIWNSRQIIDWLFPTVLQSSALRHWKSVRTWREKKEKLFIAFKCYNVAFSVEAFFSLLSPDVWSCRCQWQWRNFLSVPERGFLFSRWRLQVLFSHAQIKSLTALFNTFSFHISHFCITNLLLTKIFLLSRQKT